MQPFLLTTTTSDRDVSSNIVAVANGNEIVLSSISENIDHNSSKPSIKINSSQVIRSMAFLHVPIYKDSVPAQNFEQARGFPLRQTHVYLVCGGDGKIIELFDVSTALTISQDDLFSLLEEKEGGIINHPSPVGEKRTRWGEASTKETRVNSPFLIATFGPHTKKISHVVISIDDTASSAPANASAATGVSYYGDSGSPGTGVKLFTKSDNVLIDDNVIADVLFADKYGEVYRVGLKRSPGFGPDGRLTRLLSQAYHHRHDGDTCGTGPSDQQRRVLHSDLGVYVPLTFSETATFLLQHTSSMVTAMAVTRFPKKERRIVTADRDGRARVSKYPECATIEQYLWLPNDLLEHTSTAPSTAVVTASGATRNSFSAAATLTSVITSVIEVQTDCVGDVSSVIAVGDMMGRFALWGHFAATTRVVKHVDYQSTGEECSFSLISVLNLRPKRLVTSFTAATSGPDNIKGKDPLASDNNNNNNNNKPEGEVLAKRSDRSASRSSSGERESAVDSRGTPVAGQGRDAMIAFGGVIGLVQLANGPDSSILVAVDRSPCLFRIPICLQPSVTSVFFSPSSPRRSVTLPQEIPVAAVAPLNFKETPNSVGKDALLLQRNGNLLIASLYDRGLVLTMAFTALPETPLPTLESAYPLTIADYLRSEKALKALKGLDLTAEWRTAFQERAEGAKRRDEEEEEEGEEEKKRKQTDKRVEKSQTKKLPVEKKKEHLFNQTKKKGK